MDMNDKRAAYLKEVMEAKGHNPRSLSLKVGSNPTLVRDIILRNTQSPTSRTWDKLADALGVPTTDLLNAAPSKSTIIQEVSDLLSKLDPEVQEQIVPQLKGLLAAQQERGNK